MFKHKHKYLEFKLKSDVFQAVKTIQNLVFPLNEGTSVIIRFFRIYDSLINCTELEKLNCIKYRSKNEIVLLYSDYKAIDIQKALSEEFENESVEICFYVCNSKDLIKSIGEYTKEHFKKLPCIYSVSLFEKSLYLCFEKKYYNQESERILQIIGNIVSEKN